MSPTLSPFTIGATMFSLPDKAQLKRRIVAVWHLWKHPQAPRAAKWLAVAVLAYALSPIDLIPDFIPVLGLLDDLILLPMGVALIIKLTPSAVWEECMQQAEHTVHRLPRWAAGAVLVVLIWLAVLGALVAWAFWPSPAQAKPWGIAKPPAQLVQGTVVRVSDGDSLWVRPLSVATSPNPPTKRWDPQVDWEVRLVDIDAPESCQAWGREAQRTLIRLVLDKPVHLEVVAKDRYGRHLGRVWLGEPGVGKDHTNALELAPWLVAQGHAWSGRGRDGVSGPLLQEENEARAAKRGLHAQEGAEPPWVFRKRNGPCYQRREKA